MIRRELNSIGTELLFFDFIVCLRVADPSISVL